MAIPPDQPHPAGPLPRSVCVYCGDTATSLDHAPPLSYMTSIVDIVAPGKRPKCRLLPCCRDCYRGRSGTPTPRDSRRADACRSGARHELPRLPRRVRRAWVVRRTTRGVRPRRPTMQPLRATSRRYARDRRALYRVLLRMPAVNARRRQPTMRAGKACVPPRPAQPAGEMTCSPPIARSSASIST